MSAATATAVPVADLVELSGHACVRAGSGRGCYQLRWMSCRTCGWSGSPFDGDQPDLLDLAHVCAPADVERHRRIFGGGVD